MDTNNKKFVALDNKGNEKEFETIFTFDSDQTKKSYIIYTAHEKDDNMLKVYANCYDKSGKNKNLKPIETEEEWNTIEAIMTKLEGLVSEKN